MFHGEREQDVFTSSQPVIINGDVLNLPFNLDPHAEARVRLLAEAHKALPSLEENVSLANEPSMFDPSTRPGPDVSVATDQLISNPSGDARDSAPTTQEMKAVFAATNERFGLVA